MRTFAVNINKPHPFCSRICYFIDKIINEMWDHSFCKLPNVFFIFLILLTDLLYLGFWSARLEMTSLFILIPNLIGLLHKCKENTEADQFKGSSIS